MTPNDAQKECLSRIASAIAHRDYCLDLSGLRCRSLPQDLRAAQTLRELNLSNCGLIVPSWLTDMEWITSLDLSGNFSLGNFMPCVHKMHQLTSLSLAHCEEPLTAIDDDFAELKNLKDLNLDGAAFTHFPAVIGRLDALTSLSCTECRSCPEDVLEVLSFLRTLRRLRLQFWDDEEEYFYLPDQIGELTALEELDLSENGRLIALTEQMERLTGLRILKLQTLESDSGLRRLPEALSALTSLEYLDLRGQQLLTEMPAGIKNLKKLKTLLLDGTGLVSMPKLTEEQLKNLEALSVHWPFPDLSFCPNLKKLTVSDLGPVPASEESEDFVQYCEDLTPNPNILVFHGQICDFDNLDFLLSFINLKELFLEGSFAALPERIGDLRFLERIVLRYSPHVRSLPESVSNLKNLHSLTIDACALSSLPEGLAGASKLVNLTLEALDELTELNLPASLWRQLKKVTINDCSRLRSINLKAEDQSRDLKLYVNHCPRMVLPKGIRLMP